MVLHVRHAEMGYRIQPSAGGHVLGSGQRRQLECDAHDSLVY